MKNVIRFISNPLRVFFRIDTRNTVDFFEKHEWLSLLFAIITTIGVMLLYYLVIKK